MTVWNWHLGGPTLTQPTLTLHTRRNSNKPPWAVSIPSILHHPRVHLINNATTRSLQSQTSSAWFFCHFLPVICYMRTYARRERQVESCGPYSRYESHAISMEYTINKMLDGTRGGLLSLSVSCSRFTQKYYGHENATKIYFHLDFFVTCSWIGIQSRDIQASIMYRIDAPWYNLHAQHLLFYYNRT